MEVFSMGEEEKKELVTRVAICVVGALLLYAVAEPVVKALRMEELERWLPWLEENKLQAIALITAALFGVSLVLFPLETPEHEPEPFCGDHPPHYEYSY